MQNPLKILVVEDDKTSSMFICEIIKKFNFGIEPDKAFDGQEALDILAKKTSQNLPEYNGFCYDLAFIDLMMPIVDGFEVIKAIRKYCGKLTMVVVVTADYSDSARKNAIESGANSVILKPIDSFVIGSIIKSHKFMIDNDWGIK